MLVDSYVASFDLIKNKTAVDICAHTVFSCIGDEYAAVLVWMSQDNCVDSGLTSDLFMESGD